MCQKKKLNFVDQCNHYTLKYAYSYVQTEPDIKFEWLAILLRIPDYRAERQLAILAEVFVSPSR